MDTQRKRYPENHWIRSNDPETAFHAYMDQQSKAYSQVKNDYITELLGDLEGKRFLDYGCGGGMFMVHAAKAGAARAVGVDAEERALDAARYFARIEKVEHLCRFIESDRFPSFPDHARFDVILMKDVVEHVPDDQELLDAAGRAIAPGGKVIVSTQNSLSLNYLIEGTYRRVFLGDKDWCGWDPTHLRFYTTFSLSRKLEKAGFSPVAWRSVYIVPYKFPGLPGSGKEFLRIDHLSGIDRTLGRMFPYNRLGWNIIVKAQSSMLVPAGVQLAEKVRELSRVAAVAAPTAIRRGEALGSTGLLAMSERPRRRGR